MQGISIFVKTIKPFKLWFSWICLCRYGLLGIDKQRVNFSELVDSCLTKLFDLLVRCIYIELLGKLLDSLEWSRKLHYRVLLMTDHAQAELEWRHQTRNVSSNYVISNRFLMAAQTAQSMQNVVGLYSYVHIYAYKRTLRGDNLTITRRQNRLQWIPNGLSNKCKGNGPKLYLRMSADFCTVQWQWWAYPYVETKRKTVSKLFRRYMDEILPIRCKTMNNQSINIVVFERRIDGNLGE